MSVIVFRNPGLIDLAFLRTFGMSAKDRDNPIGFFGTGLKYAIAILLRENCEIVLNRGPVTHRFATTRCTVRGKDFDMVTMDGEELGFTLQLGRNWSTWMAFRELRSNAIDEGGDCFMADEYLYGGDETAFVVKGDAINRAYAERDLIFLSTAKRFSTGTLDVHNGQSSIGYYRAVRTLELQAQSLYTYNLIAPFQLTEDRTFQSPMDFYYEVAKAIVTAKDIEFLRRVVLAPDGSMEFTLPQFSFCASNEFVEVVAMHREAGRIGNLIPLALHNFGRATGRRPLPPPVELNRIQKTQLDRAIAFCKNLGWTVDEYPIVVVPHATGGTLAFAEDKKIVLTLSVFDMGAKTVAHALYEEWLHNKLGLRDETREMQTHLFRQVIGLGEQIMGEAL